MEKGLIHLYCGDGKGKTTAAMGLALRMLGNGEPVTVVQFLKGRETGELAPLLSLGAKVSRTDSAQKFFPFMTSEEQEQCRKECLGCLETAERAMAGDGLVVLDEVCAALKYQLLPLERLLAALRQRADGCEVVLTGRNPPEELLETADYITEMACIRHPYEKGISARKGVEY